MQPLFTYLLTWFHAQPPLAQIGILIAITQAIATFIVGLIPQRWGNNPLVKALGHYGYAKFSDAFGTWKWPGFSARDPQGPDATPPRVPPMPMFLFVMLAFVASCTGANGQPMTAAEFGHDVYVVGHDAAKAICRIEPVADVLFSIAANAIAPGSPAIAVEPVVAKAFCDGVAMYDAAITRDANRVMPADQVATQAPVYLIGPHTFAIRAHQ